MLAAHKGGRLGGAKVYGALSSLIGVSKQYVTAVEALLGGALQNVSGRKRAGRENGDRVFKAKPLRARNVFAGVVRERAHDRKPCCGGKMLRLYRPCERACFVRDAVQGIIDNLLGRCVVVRYNGPCNRGEQTVRLQIPRRNARG